MTMTEVQVTRPNVGQVNLIGDVPPGEEFRIKHIAFAEFIDATGERHAISKRQAVGIMRLARTPEEAALIVAQGDEGGTRA